MISISVILKAPAGEAGAENTIFEAGTGGSTLLIYSMRLVLNGDMNISE